jgi:CHAT domain-containing protein
VFARRSRERVVFVLAFGVVALLGPAARPQVDLPFAGRRGPCRRPRLDGNQIVCADEENRPPSRMGGSKTGFEPNPPFQTAAFWSPGGKLVARLRRTVGTGPRDDERDEVTVFSTEDPRVNYRFFCGAGGALNAAFSPDDRFVAVGGPTLCVYRLRDLQMTASLPSSMHLGAEVAFSPDGRKLVQAVGMVARFLAVDPGGAVAPDAAHPEPRMHMMEGVRLAVRPGGVELAVAGRKMAAARGMGGDEPPPNETIRLYDFGSGTSTGALVQHQAPIARIVYSPGGRHLASLDERGTLLVWPDRKGRAESIGTDVSEFAFLDEDHVVAGLAGGRVALHAIGGPSPDQTLALDAPVDRLAVHAKRGLVAVQLRDNRIVVWNPKSGATIRLEAPYALRGGLGFSAEGESLCTVESDGPPTIVPITSAPPPPAPKVAAPTRTDAAPGPVSFQAALDVQERALETCRGRYAGRQPQVPGYCYGDALITLFAQHGDALAGRRLEAFDAYIAAQPTLTADTAARYRLLWHATPSGPDVMRRLQDEQARAVANLYARQAGAARAHAGSTALTTPPPAAVRGGGPAGWMDDYARAENQVLDALGFEQNAMPSWSKGVDRVPAPELLKAGSLYQRWTRETPTLARLLDLLPGRTAYLQLVEYHSAERAELDRVPDTKSYDLGLRPLGRRRYFGFIATRSGGVVHVSSADLGPADDIDGQVRELRRDITDRKPLGDRPRQLYQTLLGPFEEGIRQSTQLLLDPVAGLHLLPFEVLQRDGGSYLGDGVVVLYGNARDVLGAEWLNAMAPAAPASPGLILANPAYDGGASDAPADESACAAGPGRGATLIGPASPPHSPALVGSAFPPHFPALKCTSIEAESIRRKARRHVELLTGPEATETALRQRERPEFLHLATHGFLLPAPMVNGQTYEQLSNAPYEMKLLVDPLAASAVALAGANLRRGAGGQRPGNDDGLLSAAEVQRLDLGGTRLVVLSACETAEGLPGAGNAFFGLRHAFRSAGAQAVIGSLWNVNDVTTSWFMSALYERYFAGDPPAVALQKARIQLRRRCPECQHPFYWAPFVIEGGRSAFQTR